MGDDTTLPSRGLRPRPIGKSIESLRTTALVLKSGKAQNEHMFSGLRPKADLPILELLPPPALRERCHRGLARRPHSRAPVCGPHAAKRPASTAMAALSARPWPRPMARALAAHAQQTAMPVIGSLIAFQPRNGRAPWPDSAVA